MSELFLIGGLIAASALALCVWKAKAGNKGGIPAAAAPQKASSGAVVDDYRKFEND